MCRIFDTSTAHRTAEGWAYGFPELSPEHMEAVKNSQYVAVPGCHASGFIALVYPLVKAGILSPDTLLSCFSVTGYSGGGKKMIAQYEAKDRPGLLDFPRQYGLTQNHKHLKEMRHITGIENFPAFCPVVGDFYSGMCVTVPVFARDLNGGIEDIKSVYRGCVRWEHSEVCRKRGRGRFYICRRVLRERRAWRLPPLETRTG